MPYDTLIGFTLLQSLQEHNNHHVSDKTTVRTLWSITVFLQVNTCHGTQNILSVPMLSWWEDGITARAAFIYSRAAFNSIDTVWVKKLRSKSWSDQWAPDKKIPNQANTEVNVCACVNVVEVASRWRAFRLSNTMLSHTSQQAAVFENRIPFYLTQNDILAWHR